MSRFDDWLYIATGVTLKVVITLFISVLWFSLVYFSYKFITGEIRWTTDVETCSRLEGEK